jgi:CubicO group peptidase (beta-lactamase class C family)
VVKDGRVVYAKAFGYADLENDVPATPQSVYRMGSITKQFTATMIMQLVHEGKLTLDTTAISVLPDLPKPWEKITVRELLNHTSGLKNYTAVEGIFDDAALKPTTPAGILKTVANDPLDFPSGTKWSYSNTGYEVLGMLIEKLDGRSYEACMPAFSILAA